MDNLIGKEREMTIDVQDKGSSERNNRIKEDAKANGIRKKRMSQEENDIDVVELKE